MNLTRTHSARWALLLLVSFVASAFSAPASVGQPTLYESALDDPVVQATAREGLDHLYGMRFTEATQTFSRLDQRYPRHPIGPFLRALNTWWEILLDLSDTSRDAKFFAQMDDVINRCDAILKRDRRNFDAYFFKGAALGMRGRLRSNRGEWFKAATDGKRAMDYVLEVARRDPQNHDYIFGKGIYDYFVPVIAQRYPFAKPLLVFFPGGDRERGIAQLTRTARHGTFIQTEAAYFLLQIYYVFETDLDQSLYYVTWLRRHHPANSFFHAFEGRVHARWSRWDAAGRIFQDVLKRYYQKAPGYTDGVAEQAYYYLARGGMAQGRYREALTHLQNLEIMTSRRSTDTYFKVWGLFRQGMVYDALGDRNSATRRYREVLTMKDWADVHGRARDYLAEPYRGHSDTAQRG